MAGPFHEQTTSPIYELVGFDTTSHNSNLPLIEPIAGHMSARGSKPNC